MHINIAQPFSDALGAFACNPLSPGPTEAGTCAVPGTAEISPRARREGRMKCRRHGRCNASLVGSVATLIEKCSQGNATAIGSPGGRVEGWWNGRHRVSAGKKARCNTPKARRHSLPPLPVVSGSFGRGQPRRSRFRRRRPRRFPRPRRRSPALSRPNRRSWPSLRPRPRRLRPLLRSWSRGRDHR